MNLNQLQSKIASLVSQYDYAEKQVRDETLTLSQSKELVIHTEEAQLITQEVAQSVQQKVHNRIASVVSKCLETVFGDDAYQFKINFNRKRGKTEAGLVFCRDGLELESPTDSSGGGPLDVASFALRLACLMLSQPPKRRLLVMDEPFKFVSREYRSRIRMMLKSLSDEMGVQFIMVTHTPELAIGNVVELE